jgi:hypothetical protein
VNKKKRVTKQQRKSLQQSGTLEESRKKAKLSVQDDKES